MIFFISKILLTGEGKSTFSILQSHLRHETTQVVLDPFLEHLHQFCSFCRRKWAQIRSCKGPFKAHPTPGCSYGPPCFEVCSGVAMNSAVRAVCCPLCFLSCSCTDLCQKLQSRSWGSPTFTFSGSGDLQRTSMGQSLKGKCQLCSLHCSHKTRAGTLERRKKVFCPFIQHRNQT